MIRVALACLLLAALFGATAGHAQRFPDVRPESPPWRVVLIRGWDSLYRVNILRETAMRNAMVAKSPKLIEFYTEEVDPLRFPGAIFPEQIALLKRKYQDKKIDLVIASGREPLDLAAAHRDEIWPGAAILFNGVYDGQLDDWKRPPRTTGITSRLDVAGTLELARKLLPKARKVYFVGGTSAFDRFYIDFARRDLARARLDGPLEAEWIVGLTQAEMMKRVRQVESDAFILHLTVLRDGRGEFGGPNVGNISLVSSRSPVPVFSAVHTQWGRGPVGGSSARIDMHGEAAGRLARTLLEGADPGAIAIESLPGPTCELDAAAMERWGIAMPDGLGCAVINARADGRTYYAWIVALAVVILLQAGLLWSLWLQSRERRKAEAQLRERGAQLAQVSRVALMGALTASIAHEINQPMGAILSNTEAALMMLDQGTLTPDKLREILADIRDEDLRASQVIASLRKLLAQHEARPAPLDVNTEVAEALRHVAFEAAHRGVSLTPSFDRDIPPVLGDPVQLQQVVINLAMNAIESVSSQPQRSREVHVDTVARPDGVEVTVADRGPGVAPADEPRLFDSMFTTKKEGMGLGLSIVRAIVESFGGRIAYERNVPRGAIFRVWLPAMGR